MKRRNLLATSLALTGWGSSFAAPSAEAYPTKAVTIIAPSGPGGGYDLVARTLSELLTKQMGATFVVDNRAGSGTLIGTQAAAVAAPDGYTLLVGGLSNLVFNAALYKQLPYDPRNDFVPVGLVARYPYVLVARGDLPQSNYKEIVDALRSDGDKLSIATAGPGSGQEVMATILARSNNSKVQLVPYKSAQAAYQDLLAGRVDLFFDTITTAKPHVDSKRAKAVVVSSEKRLSTLPDTPTAREVGATQLEMGTWFGLFAQSKVPEPVVARLRTALNAVISNGELNRKLEHTGIEVLNMSMPATDAFMKSEYAKWTAVIKQAGITLD